MFVRYERLLLLGLRVEEDSFLCFYSFMKASKISGLKEWAELVASQLTQITTNANKIK